MTLMACITSLLGMGTGIFPELSRRAGMAVAALGKQVLVVSYHPGGMRFLVAFQAFSKTCAMWLIVTVGAFWHYCVPVFPDWIVGVETLVAV